jgi:hypothetical protein
VYPPLVLSIIVGTGHHRVLDGAAGALTWSSVSSPHGSFPATTVRPPRRRENRLSRAVALAVGYALAVDLADAVSSERVSLTHPSLASIGVPLMIVTAAVVSRRA